MSDRVERELASGTSAILSRRAMELFYGALRPIAHACVLLRIGPNAITFASLGLGLVSAVAVGSGHFGLGGVLAAVGAIGDALDGLVARATGRASAAGELLDAAVDRYTEFAFLGGLAIALRENPWILGLVLLALAASFMVSYSTAKAEALGVTPPRGSMRRSERAVLLIGSCALTPFAGLGPVVGALFLVAVIGNISAVRRMIGTARLVA